MFSCLFNSTYDVTVRYGGFPAFIGFAYNNKAGEQISLQPEQSGQWSLDQLRPNAYRASNQRLQNEHNKAGVYIKEMTIQSDAQSSNPRRNCLDWFEVNKLLR